MEDFKLLNGVTIPKIGFGTYKSVEGEDKGDNSQGIALRLPPFGYSSFLRK